MTRMRSPQSNKGSKHKDTQTHTHTDQRSSAGASAERLVEGWAAELQLLEVTIRNSDVSRQRQTLVEVLKCTDTKKLLRIDDFVIDLKFLWVRKSAWKKVFRASNYSKN